MAEIPGPEKISPVQAERLLFHAGSESPKPPLQAARKKLKIGLISDIHANYDALTVVLDFFKKQGIRMVFCCGDIIGYGAQPNECINELKKINAVCVAGNHEYGALGMLSHDYFNTYGAAALDWTMGVLTKDSLDFLRGLPLSHVDRLGFRMVHGSPFAPGQFEYIFTLAEAIPGLNSFTEHICFVGHSHLPRAFYLRLGNGIFGDLTGDKFFVENNLRYIISPGSVGQPRDRDNRACCGIYDMKENLFTRTRLEYDIKSAREKIIKAGLPDFLADRLENGV